MMAIVFWDETGTVWLTWHNSYSETCEAKQVTLEAAIWRNPAKTKRKNENLLTTHRIIPTLHLARH